MKNVFITGVCLAALVAPAFAAQSQVTAKLEPQSIALGESAQLTVTSNEPTQSGVPHVDGLEIEPIGQQTSIQMINGNVTTNVEQLFSVTPNRTGDFTIPAIGGSGQPIKLHVDQASGGQTQRTIPRSHLPAPSFSQPSNSAAVDTKNQSAFLRIELPKQELTVGELVAVKVKAYFRAGVSASLNGLPTLSSDAFTLNKLDDNPEQTNEVINGVPYTVVTWTSALSAVKAGDYPLNLDLPVMVRVQEKGSRRNNPFKDFFSDDSGFDDPFFDNFFSNATQKPLTLHTDGATVKIKPLPTQGRPADFSGAVGQFEVSSAMSEDKGTTGDPLTLKIKIEGRGNFDRVTTTGLANTSDWKTYKPNGKFTANDSAGIEGEKTFEQSIVPTKAGAQEIPALNFSYFDPEAQRYVTKSTTPIAIHVAQGNASAPAATPAPVAEAPKPNSDGLAPDQPVTGRAVSNLRPLVLTPWFIAINVLVLTVLAFGMLVRWLHRRRSNDPQRLRREATEKSMRESLAKMDAALRAGDAARFFTAARHALQEKLAAKWKLPTSRVTIPEIRARLNGNGEEIRCVFQTADEIAYSGRKFTLPDLQQWRAVVQQQLLALS
ncbi:MAG TPA: BatD family protein [Chthoniobacterales bacterium]|nr:BatD family protein [Chthoniobacterales bacterium]